MAVYRFSGTEWFTTLKECKTFIFGAGGIGSWLTLFMSRIGMRTHVYDYDMLEDHNLGGQFFSNEMIGFSKTTALAGSIAQFGAMSKSMEFVNYKVTNSENVSQLLNMNGRENIVFVVTAFDNMKARKTVFESFKSKIHNTNRKYVFIDPRLSLETIQIFVLQTEEDCKNYEENYLFEDSEVEDQICSMKQSSHIAAMCGSYITNIMTNIIENYGSENEGFEGILEVPFKLEWDSNGMVFKTE